MALKYLILLSVVVVALTTPSFADYPKPPFGKPPNGGEKPPHEHKPPFDQPPKGGEKPLPVHEPPVGKPPKGGEKPLPEHKPPMEEQPRGGYNKPLPEHNPPMEKPPKGEEKPPKKGEEPPSHGYGHTLMENAEDFHKSPRKMMHPIEGHSKKPFGDHPKPPHKPPHSE